MKKIKNYLALILIFVCSSLVYAQSFTRTYSIVDWSKGLSNYTSIYLIEKNQGITLQNVRVNKTFGSLSKRSNTLSYGTVGAFKVNSLFRYYKSDATKYLITAYSTLLAYGTDSTGTFTTLHTGLASSDRVDFLTYKDIAIMIPESGDNLLKWDGEVTTTANTDGSRTAGYLCAELGAPFAEQNTGANLTASKWYAYQIAYYNSTTSLYSNSYTSSNTLLTGSSVQDIALTEIPIGASGTTDRVIYRTEGYASRALLKAALVAEELYKVDELNDNTTVIFADTVADATLDNDVAPTWTTASAGTDVSPPTGKYGAIVDQRLFIAGNDTYKSDIYYSEQLFPDIFKTGTDYEQVRPDDGDVITFIKTLLGILRVGKTNSIQSFYTKGAVGAWYISDPFTSVGCPAPYTAIVTPKGLFYLSWDNIYNFNGQYANPISEGVTNNIRDISKVNIGECVASYLGNEYRLSYVSDASGGTINNRVLIYDIIKDAYVEDILYVNCYATFNSGTDSYVLYSGSSDTDGYVLAYSTGTDLLNIDTKSELDSGTKDDTHSYGTESSPKLDLGWDCTIAGWLAELQTKNASINTIANIETYLPAAVIARPDTDGNWISPVFQVNAGSFNKLYWNEMLEDGDVTFQIRTGDVTPVDGTWTSWTTTAYTDPLGSDISAETAGIYIQIKASFSTTDIDTSPYLYFDNGFVMKIDYLKGGSVYETSIVSIWEGGFTDFDIPSFKNNIQRIKIFYTGTLGTLNIAYTNDEGSFSNSFDIDLSIAPDAEVGYTGLGDYKVYTHIPGTTEDTKGQFYKFKITESGITEWDVSRIEVMFDVTEIYD